jgi:hypothetical protein
VAALQLRLKTGALSISIRRPARFGTLVRSLACAAASGFTLASSGGCSLVLDWNGYTDDGAEDASLEAEADAPAEAACSASCAGCCDDGGACEPGASDLACGARGASCTSCGAGLTCSSGACTLPTDASPTCSNDLCEAMTYTCPTIAVPQQHCCQTNGTCGCTLNKVTSFVCVPPSL